jgi:hypothetical protein
VNTKEFLDGLEALGIVASEMTPPFPARPINGGPLERARPKLYPERWAYEPKVNGWRAVIHAPTGAMFNRHGEPMSIVREFADALATLKNWNANADFEWLDCEAFERRHNLGRGSLVLFDYIPKPNDKTSWGERQLNLQDAIHPCGEIRPGFHRWQFDCEPPPQNAVLRFLSPFGNSSTDHYWKHLQDLNKHWNAEVFEGLVAKRTDVPYPHTTSPDHATPHWIKHRWAY